MTTTNEPKPPAPRGKRKTSHAAAQRKVRNKEISDLIWIARSICRAVVRKAKEHDRILTEMNAGHQREIAKAINDAERIAMRVDILRGRDAAS